MYLGLPSQANTKTFQANPTLAAGDVKVSIDGGTLNNLTTLPTVTPAAGKMVKISLSAAEMNGDNITVVAADVSGAEWCDVVVNIQTSVRQIDDLAYPATSGRSFLVDTSGNVNTNLVNIAGSAVSSSTAQLGVNVVQAGAVAWNSGAIQAATLANNAITAAKISGGAITNAKFAIDAIDATVLAAGAVTEIADGMLDRTDAVETGYTPRQALRILLAAEGGKVAISGGTVTIRNVTDAKDRITATTDASGQRTAVTLDAT
jgi:hypothetical protein